MSKSEGFPIWDERHNLANFGPVPVTMFGHPQVPTSEHVYQALKFIPLHPEIVAQIEAASTPSEAKKIAKQNHEKIRPDWNEIRCKRMAVVIRTKLRQNPNLQQELLETEDKYIYEDANQYAPENPSKEQIGELRRWGIYQGEGENWIGEILMNFRSRLQETGKI